MTEHQSLQNNNPKKSDNSPVSQLLPEQAISASPYLNIEQSMLHLQRTIGNYAILKMMGATSTQQQPKIQRSEIGLEQSDLSDHFVKNGYAYWKKKRNKDESTKEYASHLVKLVNDELATFGVPPTNHDFRESNAVGAFRQSEWKIYFNIKKLNREGDTIDELTQNEAADLANTVYHEARHAEQSFRIARMLAGMEKTAEDIASELPIPQEIAEQAVQSPLKNTADTKKEFEEAEEWYNISVGRYRIYRREVGDYHDEAFEVYNILEDLTDENFDESKEKISTFMTAVQDTKTGLMETEKTKAEEVEEPNDADNLIRQHIDTIIDTSYDAVIQWVDSESATNAEQLKRMKQTIEALWLATFNAYKDFANEKDAWEVGADAGKKFENK